MCICSGTDGGFLVRVISLAFSAFGCFFGSRVVVVEELVIAFASGIVVLMTMMMSPNSCLLQEEWTKASMLMVVSR